MGAFSFTCRWLVQGCPQHGVLPQWPDLFIFISKSSLLSLLINTFWDISNNSDLFFPEKSVHLLHFLTHDCGHLSYKGQLSHPEDWCVPWIYRGSIEICLQGELKNAEGSSSGPCFTSAILYRLQSASCPTEPGGSHGVTSHLLLSHNPNMLSWGKPCQSPFSGCCQECLIQAIP